MKKLTLIILLISAMCGRGLAQNVSVEARIDSMAIFIGQQVGVTLTAIAPQGQKVELPAIEPRQYITPGVEVVEVQPIDSSTVDGAQRISRKILLTSFDENAYKIPALDIKVDGKSYQTNPLALKVLTVDVDTTQLDRFFPPKDVQDNPFSWDEWLPLIWLSLICVALCLIGAYLYKRYKENKPIISKIRIVKRIPAHQKALTAIDKIKQERLSATENQKEYYTQLTDTLRRYIEERFGFSAMEMTSSEIIENLQQAGDPKMIGELRELFNTADLVKFAKHSTLINENDLNLVNAVNFIDQTKTEEREREEKIMPTLSENDKRVQESRKLIKVLLGIIAVAVVGIFVFVVYNIMLLI